MTAFRTASPAQPQVATAEPPLTTKRLLGFAAFSVPVHAAAQPIVAFVPAIFSRQYDIPLATLGLIFLIGQVLNSLIAPLIGTLSDRTSSPLGRRRPWIAGGGLLFLIGSAMLFFPPQAVGVTWLWTGVLLYYLGAAISTTTLLAWSGEITRDYAQRTRISGLFTLLSSAGLVLALLLPTLADQLRPNDDGLRLTLLGLLVLATAVPGLALTLTAFPDSPARPGGEGLNLSGTLRAVFGNRLLLRVLASDVAVTTGQGIRTALMLFVVTVYLQRPEWAAGIFLFQYSFGLLAGPIWQRIGMALGKARAAVLAELVQAAINASLLLVTPDSFGLMLFLAFAQGLSQGSGNLLLRAMVADVADHHRLETGEERTGLYYSVFSVSMKLGGAIAVGIALPLVGWLGFDPKGANSPEDLQALLTVFALGPAIAHALSAALLLGFPLGERAHSEIRARLEDDPPTLQPAE